MKAGFRRSKRFGEPGPNLKIKRRYNDEIHDDSQACREFGPSAPGTDGSYGDNQGRGGQSRHYARERGGLAPTAQSTRVRVSKGQLTVTDGPFTEAKEVVG